MVFIFFGGRLSCGFIPFFRRMLLGPAGAQEFCSLKGSTIHRRKICILRLSVDFHARVSQQDMGTSSFGDPGYLSRLGEALGNMAPAVFDDFCAVALRKGTQQDVGRATRTAMYFGFPEDGPLYLALLETDFGQSLRMMMSKFWNSRQSKSCSYLALISNFYFSM